VWFLRWFPFAVSHHLNPLFTDYQFYPHGLNLMWNTPVPLLGALLAPATVAFGPVLAYNLAITLAPALSAWACFVMLGRYVESRVARGIGGLVYGFSPYVVIQSVGHLHAAVAWTPPLILILLDEIVVRQRRSAVRMGILLGLLCVSQLLISEEVLATEVITAAVGVSILALLHRSAVRRHARHMWVALAGAGAVSLPLSAFPLWEQFFGPQRIAGVLQPRNTYVTDLLNFIVPTDFQAIAPRAAVDISNHFAGNGSEWNGYLGITLVLLCAYTVWRCWRIALVRFVGLLGLAMAVLSMGPHLHIAGHDTIVRLPYLVIDHLPLFGNLLASRLAVYVSLCAAILLAVFADSVFRAPSSQHKLIGAIAVMAALAPIFPRLPYSANPLGAPGFFSGSSVAKIAPGSVALVAPYTSDPASVDPVLWQALADLRYRMPGGYSFAPDVHGHPRLGPQPFPLSIAMRRIAQSGGSPPLSPETRSIYISNLRAYRVSSVIVGPVEHESDMLAFFSDLLRRRPVEAEGVFVWYGIDE
jgi:hypothetical protein